METITNLIKDTPIPKMVKVRQTFDKTGAAVIQGAVLGKLADANGVAFRSGKGGGSGQNESSGDSDHALHHRNTSCFLGVQPCRLVSSGKAGE